jgi:hypothetical protein
VCSAQRLSGDDLTISDIESIFVTTRFCFPGVGGGKASSVRTIPTYLLDQAEIFRYGGEATW